MKYNFKIHKESEKSGGYWAECLELPGCFAQAESLADLKVQMKEALDLYIQEPENSIDLAALPGKYKEEKI